jgi:hypothetical protein
MTASTQSNSGAWSPGDNLRLLEQRLGIKPSQAARLKAECSIFSEICADYEECITKRLGFEQNGSAASQQARDYRELCDELERELRRCLEDPAACQNCRRQIDPTDMK